MRELLLQDPDLSVLGRLGFDPVLERFLFTKLAFSRSGLIFSGSFSNSGY